MAGNNSHMGAEPSQARERLKELREQYSDYEEALNEYKEFIELKNLIKIVRVPDEFPTVPGISPSNESLKPPKKWSFHGRK